jgi:Domain of unknown function (DUF5655)
VEYVDVMFSGKKVHLQPVYDKLIVLATALGDGVRLSPAKTFVPVYRNHVVAQIKPTTLTRIDVGLALKGFSEALPDRVIPTGGLEKGDRITHRIPVLSVEEADDEVARWLHVAYALDSK